jgi:hypothetical protein
MPSNKSNKSNKLKNFGDYLIEMEQNKTEETEIFKSLYKYKDLKRKRRKYKY